MSVRNYPKSLRFAALKLLSHGLSMREIDSAINVGYVSIHRWSKRTGITRKTYLTDEEIEAKMETMADETRELSEDENDPDIKRARDYLNRRKFGGTPEQMADAVLGFEDLGGDADEIIADLRKHFGRVMEQMALATTPEKQIENAMGLVALRQWVQVARNPPPVTTMGDLEKLVKITSVAFHLDEKTGENEGADLRILTARIVKNKIVEAEEVVDPPKRGKKKTTRKKRQ